MSEEEAKRKLSLQSRDSAARKLQATLADAAGQAAAAKLAAQATSLSQLESLPGAPLALARAPALCPNERTLTLALLLTPPLNPNPTPNPTRTLTLTVGAPPRHFSPLGAFAAATGWTSHGGASQRHMSSLLAGVAPPPRAAPPADPMMWRSINPATHTA